MARKITDIVQVKLRIPEWLRRDVLQAAKKSGRSLNGELFHLIEEGLARPQYEALIEKASEAAARRTVEISRGSQLLDLPHRTNRSEEDANK